MPKSCCTVDGAAFFQFNKVLNIETKTADGVTFLASTIQKDDTVETALKTAYKTKTYAFNAAFNAAGKLSTSLAFNDVAPGVTATVSGTLPDVTTAKLGIDYIAPYINVKSLIGLTQSPKVDLAATTGYKDLTLGAIVSYDSLKSDVTGWSIVTGLTRPDYQGAVILTDKGQTLKVAYAHNIDAFTTAGGEVVKKSVPDKTTFTVGFSKVLEGGALAKVRLDSEGVTSLLYEQALSPHSTLALSSQFDATDLSKTPKFGVALNLKN
eukprot:jgi/Botrbrau1/4958/Bobra.0122s0033.1